MCEIEATINAYLDDEISPDQLVELESWLRQSKENRETFVRATHLHRTLRDMTFGQNAHSAISPLADETEISVKSKPNIRGVLVGLAATALVLLVGYQLVSQFISTFTEIGTVAKADNCQWEDPNFDLAQALTSSSTLSLVSGVAEINLSNGVRVTMQDETSLRFDSESRARLLNGTISVFVPKQAKGFQVIAPAVTVTDLGTEFGVLAAKDSRTEVHVFKGTVEIETRIGTKIRIAELNANQAAIIDFKTRNWQQGLVRPEYFAGRIQDVESNRCYAQSSERIVMEAEAFSVRSDEGTLGDIWQEQQGGNNASGNGYMQTLVNGAASNARYGVNNQFGGAWVAYDFKISQPGNYYVWVRSQAMGSASKVLAELLHTHATTGSDIRMVPATTSSSFVTGGSENGTPRKFNWRQIPWDGSRASIRLTEGEYRLRFFTGQVGPMLDKIVIQPTVSSAPEGHGPDVSPLTR